MAYKAFRRDLISNSLKFPLHILINANGEKAYAETVRDSFVVRFDNMASGFSVCRMNTEIVTEKIQECILQKFRDEGMEQILSDSIYQPPICLAEIHTKEKNGHSVIDKIFRMPFDQYISTDLATALQEFFAAKEQDKVQEEHHLENTLSNSEKLISKYSISSGITEISMPMGGRTGQHFYSQPISHGLGIGQVSITLGLEDSDNNIVYGDTSVFSESEQDLNVKLAAKSDSSMGTFVIGMLLTEPTSITKVRVHWTAIQDHSSEITEHHPRLLINPNVASLYVMESMTFEVYFEQMPKQKVHWSVAEGARGGVITEGGAYTAPNTPGVYQINVQALESGIKAAAFVSVRSIY